jgi:hypothetical protein
MILSTVQSDIINTNEGHAREYTALLTMEPAHALAAQFSAEHPRAAAVLDTVPGATILTLTAEVRMPGRLRIIAQHIYDFGSFRAVVNHTER